MKDKRFGEVEAYAEEAVPREETYNVLERYEIDRDILTTLDDLDECRRRRRTNYAKAFISGLFTIGGSAGMYYAADDGQISLTIASFCAAAAAFVYTVSNADRVWSRTKEESELEEKLDELLAE